MCVSEDTGDHSDGSATSALPFFPPQPSAEQARFSDREKKNPRILCGFKQNLSLTAGEAEPSNTEQSSGFQGSLLALF